MEPICFKITDNMLKKMKKFYDSQLVDFDESEYLLKAKTINCQISVDSNYQASFVGQNAMHEALHWNRSLAKKVDEEIKHADTWLHHHIGAAETGSNDFIGPLCIVACYADEEAVKYIHSLNIEDVNSLTDEEIIRYAKDLKTRVISSLLVLDNSHYNDMINKGYNQANIRARLFNQSIVNVLQKAKKNVKIKVIEKYISPKTYFNYLKNEVIVVKDLSFEKDAVNHYMSVLAAEIISRYAYIQYFASMSKSLKMELGRGNAGQVDQIVIDIAHKYGSKILTKVVKSNFTNMKRVMQALEKDVS